MFLWACRCCQTLEMQFQALHVNWNITACNSTCGRFSVWFLTPRTAKTCCCFLITSHSFLSTPFHYFCSLQLQSCRMNWKRANRRGFTIGELSREETPECRNETGARCTSKGRRWSHWQMRFSQTCIGMFFPTVVIVWKKNNKTTRRWETRAAGSSRLEKVLKKELKGQEGDTEINERSNEKNGEDRKGEEGPPVKRGEAVDWQLRADADWWWHSFGRRADECLMPWCAAAAPGDAK